MAAKKDPRLAKAGVEGYNKPKVTKFYEMYPELED